MSRFLFLRSRAVLILAWLSTALLVLVGASFAYGRNASSSFVPASVANHAHAPPSGSCPPTSRPASPAASSTPSSASPPASSATPAQANDAPGLAKTLTPAELLCRPPSPNSAAVPKLFHQSWKTNTLPAKFQRWSDSCREAHPDWEWVLWTDDDNLRLVKEHFPWLEETYLDLPGPIYRADLARNLYMYKFGGVYADLDTECLLDTTDGLESYDVKFSGHANLTASDVTNTTKVAIFGRMGSDTTFEQSIPNAWMAASPAHPFFLRPLEFAHHELDKSNNFFYKLLFKTPNAEHITGPIALRKTILAYESSGDEDEIVLLPGRMVYPYNWYEPGSFHDVCSAEQETFDDARCKQLLEVKKKKSISITYWSHTHKGEGSNKHNIELISSD
ncbi:glycosyltransferase family 32 protein [Dactylonectria estremocensis]|uniref:Glycosyltransferase family 32 protein n=1 Tax=Dactylonectria estremocensis TaxID=1079267 RepID=A0A9P9IIF5_9HYPO|nr:glycosyltransferase family 32 protein [Dactylonectria estremocensis]